jgi:WD40 repeat protein
VHKNFINGVAISPCGTKVASVGNDKAIYITSTEDLSSIKLIDKPHGDKSIYSVHWLDETHVVTCATDNKLLVVNTETEKVEKTMHIYDDKDHHTING